MAKTIRTFTATYGGVAYRVSVSKDTAYYSTRNTPSARWQVKAREDIAAFQAWARQGRSSKKRVRQRRIAALCRVR